MIEMPDHDDGNHVPFSEAMGYGVSTLLNWIAYILAITIVNIVMFAFVMWLSTEAMVSENEAGMFLSLIVTFVASFIMFVLTAALLIAMGYKFWSDVGMKAASAVDLRSSKGGRGLRKKF